MEELFLGALLAGEKLYVVDEKNVHTPVFIAEREGAAVLDGVDHLIHESLGGCIAYSEVEFGVEY